MKTLTVDDKEENLLLLETLLKASGHEVVSAKNGVEALERLKKDSIDMIISDILMPKMDGFRLCRECKRDDSLRKIPFVFYTATYTDKKDEEFALSLGAERFIVKPMGPDEFIKVIKGVIRDVERGKIGQKKPALKEEEDIFKLYSERLVRKLESKMLALEEVHRKLIKRIKELTYLYSLSKLTANPDLSLEDIFRGTANLIPLAWQYPDVTCGRVTFEGREFRTDNYKKTKWIQSAEIKVDDRKVGTVEVYYLEEKPEIDEGPFFKEERNLINSIADHLGKTTERKKMKEEAEKHLHDLEVFYKANFGREERILELKEEIKQLKKELKRS